MQLSIYSLPSSRFGGRTKFYIKSRKTYRSLFAIAYTYYHFILFKSSDCLKFFYIFLKFFRKIFHRPF